MVRRALTLLAASLALIAWTAAASATEAYRAIRPIGLAPESGAYSGEQPARPMRSVRRLGLSLVIILAGLIGAVILDASCIGTGYTNAFVSDAVSKVRRQVR